MRLDAFLAEKYDMTRTKAKQSIERGLAYVNGTQCFKPAAVIKDTDFAELKKLHEYASSHFDIIDI